MTKKFTLDGIHALREMLNQNASALREIYTPIEFKPHISSNLKEEQFFVSMPSNQIIDEMTMSLRENGDEFEAGKLLYENLALTPKQAADIGFWTFHNHYTFYRYIAERWSSLWTDEGNDANRTSYILDHWIQTKSNQSDLIRYPISGLWWSFHITIDPTRSDQYELTKLFFKNETLRTRQLGNAKFARHKPAVLSILEFMKQNEFKLENASRTIIPYLNLLGGIRPLSYFEKDWFTDKLNNRFSQLISTPNSKIDESHTQRSTLDRVASVQAPVESKLQFPLRYFCLNAETGSYKMSSTIDLSWDYCVGMNFQSTSQFIIHFYREGKIKKSKIKGGLSLKAVDRDAPYSNGKCPKLELAHVELIERPVLFGIAYRTVDGVFFKAMDEQVIENFRIDNSEIRQEGKKVLYVDEPFQTAFKVLPYEIKESLGTLVQQSPTSKGADITNKYYADKWQVLKKHWEELFNGSINWG
jgi:hypothetical protein